MIQIMTKALYMLLQSWGRVQYAIRFYNLAQDNVSPLKSLHFSEGYASAKPL